MQKCANDEKNIAEKQDINTDFFSFLASFALVFSPCS